MNVYIYGNNYEIDDELLEFFKEYNINLDKEYYDYLKQYKSPYRSLDEDFVSLINCDLANRLLVEKYGKIVCINGKKVNMYDSITDAILNNFDLKAKFLFYNLADDAFSDYNFFKVKIEIINNVINRKLNLYAKQVILLISKSKPDKYYSDPYFKSKLGDMIYDDYISQQRKYHAFTCARSIMESSKIIFPKDRSNINIDGYKQILSEILNRYSFEGKSAFVKVNDLNDCDEYTGIYILCLEKEMAFYVGQTRENFKSRIIKHLYGLETFFDCNHIASDITDIYIMHMNGRFMDDIEEDLIAYIPSNYSLNIVSGGFNREFVYRESYNPKKYLLNEKQVKFRSKESLKIRDKEEYFHNLSREYDKCKKIADKFMKISDDLKTYSMCLNTVKYKGDYLLSVPLKFRDERMCYEALNSFEQKDIKLVVSCIPENVLTHEFALKLVSKDGSIYYALPKKLQTREMQLATGYKKFLKM